MKKPVDPAAGAPTFTIVRDLATGKVLRVETVLADGSLRVLYPLTPEQRDERSKLFTKIIAALPLIQAVANLVLTVGAALLPARSAPLGRPSIQYSGRPDGKILKALRSCA